MAVAISVIRKWLFAETRLAAVANVDLADKDVPIRKWLVMAVVVVVAINVPAEKVAPELTDSARAFPEVRRPG